LSSLVPSIRRTADLVQEISAATREQNEGAEQINKAIRELDSVIQQNASSSTEAASVSEQLASQSDQLRAVISFFSLGDTHSIAVPAVASRHTAAPKAPMKRSKSRTAPIDARSNSVITKRPESRGVALDLGPEDISDAEFGPH
jgi:methyl-accepting chemotaxis protein